MQYAYYSCRIVIIIYLNLLNMDFYESERMYERQVEYFERDPVESDDWR